MLNQTRNFVFLVKRSNERVWHKHTTMMSHNSQQRQSLSAHASQRLGVRLLRFRLISLCHFFFLLSGSFQIEWDHMIMMCLRSLALSELGVWCELGLSYGPFTQYGAVEDEGKWTSYQLLIRSSAWTPRPWTRLGWSNHTNLYLLEKSRPHPAAARAEPVRSEPSVSSRMWSHGDLHGAWWTDRSWLGSSDGGLGLASNPGLYSKAQELLLAAAHGPCWAPSNFTLSMGLNPIRPIRVVTLPLHNGTLNSIFIVRALSRFPLSIS